MPIGIWMGAAEGPCNAPTGVGGMKAGLFSRPPFGPAPLLFFFSCCPAGELRQCRTAVRGGIGAGGPRDGRPLGDGVNLWSCRPCRYKDVVDCVARMIGHPPCQPARPLTAAAASLRRRSGPARTAARPRRFPRWGGSRQTGRGLAASGPRPARQHALGNDAVGWPAWCTL